MQSPGFFLLTGYVYPLLCSFSLPPAPLILRIYLPEWDKVRTF